MAVTLYAVMVLLVVLSGWGCVAGPIARRRRPDERRTVVSVLDREGLAKVLAEHDGTLQTMPQQPPDFGRGPSDGR